LEVKTTSTQNEVEKSGDKQKIIQWHCQNQLCNGCPAELECAEADIEEMCGAE